MVEAIAEIEGISRIQAEARMFLDPIFPVDPFAGDHRLDRRLNSKHSPRFCVLVPQTYVLRGSERRHCLNTCGALVLEKYSAFFCPET